jgi:hypothetical protein
MEESEDEGNDTETAFCGQRRREELSAGMAMKTCVMGGPCV